MSTTKTNYAIELKEISKTFGSVVANDNISLNVQYGEILALLGENGSGKTTLMNMLSGIYYPDAGTISIAGEEVTINSPKDAIDNGIGMIHQHFKLVDVFSAMDNIVLGTEGKYIKPKILKEKIIEISNKFGLEVEPEKKVYNMSVSEKQTVEIIKVLYRGARILILDEPTAVL
ncbi:MAG: ATP-binding cassette domain-containing protein, partial [Tissierellia bacterium]|nr:ATP-binding cassette domain-containing protein [Tissierellia bacterium]